MAKRAFRFRRMGRGASGIAVIAMTVAAVASCSTLRVGSDSDHSASFGSYSAYSWRPREHRSNASALTVQRARDAVDSELSAKGFRQEEDPAKADFIVDFTIGSHDRVDIAAYPDPFVEPGQEWTGWWGGAYWGDQLDVYQYREGTLSIDIFDARTHRPVWHGWAKKELSPSDIASSTGPIHEAVKAILRSFPPH